MADDTAPNVVFSMVPNVPVYKQRTYKFKPWKFEVLEGNNHPLTLSAPAYRIVCNDSYLYSYGSYDRQTTDASGGQISSTIRELWKYCFDLGEWKKIICKTVPQYLGTSSVTLSGNIIIIYSGYDRMYLGNLANEYKEDGMKFEKLEVSDNVLLPSYRQGVAIYSKYFYSIGDTAGNKYEMDVHRFDFSSKTWELLHKSSRIDQDIRYLCQPVFYKDGIYIFGYGRQDSTDHYNRYSEIHMFDVTTKKWEFLPAKQDPDLDTPGYPNNQSCPSCIAQFPEKPNLIYICAGITNYRIRRDVWRFDLDNLQWEKLTWFALPHQMNIHSTAITPSGRICYYGDIVSRENRDDLRHSKNIISAWITIPKLKVICWEAMLHYFKDQMLASSDTQLKKVGIPQEFYERMIEARRHFVL